MCLWFSYKCPDFSDFGVCIYVYEAKEHNRTYFKCNTMIFSDHNIKNNNFKVNNANWPLELLSSWWNHFCLDHDKNCCYRYSVQQYMQACCALVKISPLNCNQQVHNNVHWRFAFTHLHLFVHDFLHPHFNSSWNALAASGRVVQCGVHVASSVSLCQPHICGGGSSGFPIT